MLSHLDLLHQLPFIHTVGLRPPSIDRFRFGTTPETRGLPSKLVLHQDRADSPNPQVLERVRARYLGIMRVFIRREPDWFLLEVMLVLVSPEHNPCLKREAYPAGYRPTRPTPWAITQTVKTVPRGGGSVFFFFRMESS